MSGSATAASSNMSNLDTPEDLDQFVQELMDNMQTRFNRLSDNILERVDSMGNKIDQLEKSINELIDEAGIETPNSVARKDSSADNHKIMGGQEESDTAEF